MCVQKEQVHAVVILLHKCIVDIQHTFNKVSIELATIT